LKITTRILATALAACAVACATPAIAQVSAEPFSKRYDKDAPMEVTGTIKRLDWGQPNVWIFLQVPDKDAAGKAKETFTVYGFTAGTTDSISHTGLNLTNVTGPVTIRGYRAQSWDQCGVHPDLGPTCKAIARTLTAPNGCTVFVGRTGIDAPKDGLDPAEGGKPATCKPG
jgi:hypothetical protein